MSDQATIRLGSYTIQADNTCHVSESGDRIFFKFYIETSSGREVWKSNLSENEIAQLEVLVLAHIMDLTKRNFPNFQVGETLKLTDAGVGGGMYAGLEITSKELA